jgi:hypothetical protein
LSVFHSVALVLPTHGKGQYLFKENPWSKRKMLSDYRPYIFIKNWNVFVSVLILPSIGVKVSTPWYEIHPKNITDTLQVCSLSPSSPRHSGHKSSFGFLWT